MSATTYRIAEDPAMPAIGSRVDERYEIRRVLGEGGFAAVFEAHDHRTGSSVAIKVLDPIMSRRGDLAERFKREVDTVARLKHHNTIKVTDSGTTPGGCLYLVMELLNGEALDDVLKREGRLAPDRVARISAQVLKSLNEAHAAGIIHRDLKPANIFLVSLVGEVDYVKVLDFGIAKSLDSGGDKGLTQTGELMCSPHYVAPERVTGSIAFPASDLYSLGIMMIELLQGAPPYDADSAMAVAVMHMRVDQPVPMDPAIENTPLGQVIRRSVAKDVTERFQSAAEMLEALNSLQGFGPMPMLTGQNAAAGFSPDTPSPSFPAPSGNYVPQGTGQQGPLHQGTGQQGAFHNPQQAQFAPQVSDATVATQKKRSGGLVFLALFLGLLVLGAAAFGAYLVIDNRSGYLPGPPGEQAVAPTDDPALAVAPDTEETADAAAAVDADPDDAGAQAEPDSQQLAAITPDAAAQDVLRITSNPEGARIYANDADLGRTPTTLDLDGIEWPATFRILQEGRTTESFELASADDAREHFGEPVALALATDDEPQTETEEGTSAGTAERPAADPQDSGTTSPSTGEPADDRTAEEQPEADPGTRPTTRPSTRPSAEEPATRPSTRPTTRPTYFGGDSGDRPAPREGRPSRYFGSN